MRKQKGFSLIELLIVVAIILIIAAIAIPSLIRSRIAANNSAATANIRTLVTAEVAYYTAYPSTGYNTASLANLGPSGAVPCSGAAACLVDGLLGCAGLCQKTGFSYFLNDGAGGTGTLFPAPVGAIPNQQFTVSTTPITMGTSGDRNVCAFEDGVIRSTNNAVPALVGPPPVLAPPGELRLACNTLAAYGPTNN
jgi:prepilin-type N-terminal cleavage/methylation domain-containing protein